MVLQVKIFVIACLFGAVLGIIYNILGVFRAIFKYKSQFIFLQDIFYLIFTGIATFLFILYVNYGEIRFYILLGEITGGLIYYVTLSNIVNRIIFKLSIIFRKYSQKFSKIFFFPLIYIYKKIRAICIKKRINVEKTNHNL